MQPDVIVLDISMPGMTGFEVASRLRKAGSKAAVVFLTVHDDEDFMQAAKAAGGIGYVVKPRLASDLAVAVLEAGRAARSSRRSAELGRGTRRIGAADYAEHAESGRGLRGTRGIRATDSAE